MSGRPLVFDGHNDVLLRLDQDPERPFLERAAAGHLDLVRAREGGFGGGFFACFPPGDKELDTTALDPARARETTTRLAARLFRLEREAGGELRLARSAAEIEACLRDGTIAAVLHFEGAEPIDPGLDQLEVLHAAGLRSLGLTWSRPNAFAQGVPFRFPGSPDSGPGLSDAGRALVGACNELRVMIDLSHLNERGFWDVAELSDAPLVATHSNAHALCPSPRNLTDEQIDAVGASGGVIGLNLFVGFLRPDGRDDPDTPLEVLVRHANHVAERIGAEHVALGSDFDGTRVPDVVGDASGIPRVLDALASAGWDEDALRAFAHGNWLRVLRATWGG